MVEVLRQNQTNGAPKVSVVITAYNAAPFISEAVDSVLQQTFTDFEIIVVNDGSPDTRKLEEVLAFYSNRIVYVKQPNKGTGAARNTGIRQARGEFIALLDGDDLWEPEYLQVQLGIIEQNSNIAVVYSNALHFGEGHSVGRTFMDVCPSEGEVTFESLLVEQCNVMVSVTARRAAIVAAGMFDEDKAMMGADDFDLWLRIAKQGSQIVYHRRPLVRRRFWKGQLSSQLVLFHASIIRVLDKVEKMPLTADQNKLLKQRQLHYRAMLSLFEGKEALFQGDTKKAFHYLTDANVFLKSWKVSCAILLLRVAPWLFYTTRIRNLLASRNT